jgi:NTE family protein
MSSDFPPAAAQTSAKLDSDGHFGAHFGDTKLRDLALFAGLDEAALSVIAERLEVRWIASGTDLFLQFEAADALYVLLSGALVVLHTANAVPGEPPAAPRRIGHVLAGETVGEMAMLSGKSRSATVRATRDSEVLRFKRSDFEALMATEPSAMLHIARVAFQRLEATLGSDRALPEQGRAFAVVPPKQARFDQPHRDQTTPIASLLQEIAQKLVQALARFGSVALITQSHAQGQTSGYFHAQEQQHRYIVYVSEAPSGPWYDLCRRQADQILHIVAPTCLPDAGTRASCTLDQLKTERLIVLNSGQIQPAQASAWRAELAGCSDVAGQAMPVHHICLQDAERYSDDMARVARFLTGNATALVLGGGGARGFAHLGVLRALREHGLHIDCVGGTSIGAIVAAGIALQWSDEELYMRYHRSFVEKNPLRDYTVPFISLVAGRQATARLKSEYNDTLIDDLPLPYYCVSTNLTRGVLNVHRDGPLWRALRASIAIPGILPPVFHDGDVLVDGGVINNLPVDVMRHGFHGRVIGVDIAGDYAIKAHVEEADLPPLWRMVSDWFRGIRPRPSILQILLRSGMVNSASTAENNRNDTDWLIKPPVDQLELLDWKSFDRAIDIGYRHTVQLLEQQESARIGGAAP